MTKCVPINPIKYFIINRVIQLSELILVFLVRGQNTLPPDQIIRFDEEPENARFTFSIWAFQEEDYIPILRAYFQFCQDYYRTTGYRTNMLNVGYRISGDTSSLFSYSFDGTIMSIDPVSTGNPGWEEFLIAYNDFCSQHGGVPLFNQTPSVTRSQVQKAFGDRLATFESYRKRFDPMNRLPNAFFTDLLQEPIIAPQSPVA